MNPDAVCLPDALLKHLNSNAQDSVSSRVPLDAVKGEMDVLYPVPLEISIASDDMLLKLVGQGEKEALSLLFRRHARAVRNIAYRVLRNEAEADDLVQEVFLFIFRKAGLYDSARGAASTWIIHVTYHRAFDRRRYLNTRHFYTTHELDEMSVRLTDSKDELHLHGSSFGLILGKSLMEKYNSGLSPEQRETIQLYFFEGYALKEIAQLMGWSLANVRNHYYRGLKRLRKFARPEKYSQSE